ncbi:2-succinyl-5-enolpyruvyl-6-hydroxy-3-cyclohexene-1-carboxylic-acid synthase [Paenilisteria rocourtiae]|uniref:2-succinyl-5-enolpyruvyl-6-hydroxy-3-cyclohexene-1-carboxylate synthase n=1 Tax=Listeria rocourtiae TaxID=647910 RepID=A0A4R6ZM51_9LIST|nr:2-succinyl-5-enolpyruvyl-6-hydroxy-3-cyclohexene-1-carboxylic-acid synthase [Listeria rocourtiae]EUJ44005.1 2-succinyl-5-enolpyruvyl-6-hydroxy-3-cyclohexene-1-carboxylate synthase [Listeria rocourtiae FSL F6-920]MBC1604038.1 2-succinyl-5-enolpyruvyl-6-hydroxy-3-cyclohexene-1-carboxylic-acid synthase [Listeria rocourtiae]TDR53448.1 2-succinyl-5-enolpyruvyl-6-hydroxy-3-cyclohexene-1-carboxylate synthase [Listeria rocourtiae]
MSDHRQVMTEYLAAFVEELVQAGVKEAVISPGSRSTPIALLMAEHPTLKMYVDVDERSAGFFALGIAKASKRPVVLLCTSGTAAANYFPAVAEANLSAVPLLVLTADRPHELRNVGAPQAMDQVRLFGSHVKDFTDMALPENSTEMLRFAKWHGSKAVDIAMNAPRGPVHLNFPLREPLMPVLEPSPFAVTEKKRRHVHIYYTHEVLEDAVIGQIIEACAGKRGVFVAGPLDKKAFSPKLVALAEQVGWPILADPLSQLRSYGALSDVVIDQYDAILQEKVACEALRPEVVVRFGAMPVSKPLMKWLEALEDVMFYVVDPGAAWKDPIKAVTNMIHCDEHFLVGALTAGWQEKTTNDWMVTWQRLNVKVKTVIAARMEILDRLDEGKLVFEMRAWIPERAGLFIGNSMPIRDIDTYFAQTNKQIRMLANRGANGIDGVVSSALGASLTEQPMYLLIGDLSFYHDMNGLLMAKKYGLNLTIIVVNNNGGGIFSFLPQASEPKYFETLFGTGADLDFRHTAALYEGDFHEVTDWDEFHDALDRAHFHKGLDIIEVKTNRYENVDAHRELWDAIKTAIRSELA